MARGQDTGSHPSRQVGRNRIQAQRIVQTLGTDPEETKSAFNTTNNPDGLEHQLYRGFFKRQQTRNQ
jgi:hypothetical protein